MKRAILTIFILLSFSIFLSACDDNSGSNNLKRNNLDNNGQKGGQCLVSTDCNSGVCKGGVCQKAGDTTCDGSGECGDCDHACRRDDIGSKKNPFTIDDNPDDDTVSSGVILDDEGAVTISTEKVETNFIWIANTGEGTISKVDTRTYKEVARYLTGPQGRGNDPSRTSVNTFSDVYVGNRTGRSITKISVLGKNCADKNGDGKITTSTGATNILPWGQDDCVLWNTSLPVPAGGIRAVAAQDGHESDDSLQPGVWVGGFDFSHGGNKIWKLDSETGKILVETDAPVPGGSYGFALDGIGNLWISAYHDSVLARINTIKCRSTAACNAAPVCDGEGAMQDKCIKQKITMPHVTYGITVDFKQRVWLGGENVSLYDPSKPAGSRFTHEGGVRGIHGIAADAKGWIWGSARLAGLYRINANNPSQFTIVPGTAQDSKGVAVDLDGKIWSINLNNSSATVVIPGAGLNDNDVKSEIVKGLVTPYTYSDMTGAQLRFATNGLGFYRQVFEGCTNVNILETLWGELRWDVETPGKSKVIFRARGGDTKAELGSAAWSVIVTVPPDTSPKDLRTILADHAIQGYKYIEIEAQLKASRNADKTIDVPKLKAMAITHSCPAVHQ